MLTEQQTNQAAALIWQSWRDGAVIADLPDAMRPTDRTEGYASH